ncbi:MAG: ABC transporter permease [Burkholderiales bacterium]
MNFATLSLGYLRARGLNAALNVTLLALGIATITLLLLVTHQLEERMMRDARGIDLVAGAKGSPLQVILSAVYHLDVPTGNIPLGQAQEIARHRMVKKAIALALGDSYKGFRIVGTSHDYLAHYGAKPAAGRLWQKPMEAVIGAEVAQRTGLGVGASFTGAHGIAEAGSGHDEAPYTIVGVLAASGSVLDRLVLTGVESVWAVHDGHRDKGAPAPTGEDGRQITALLIQYATPLAVALLPRYINGNSEMQAASPAYETARLFGLIGVGVDVLRGFALVLIFSAGLSVFIALYNALNERRYDLAVMRTLGASRGKLMRLMLFEGVLLAFVGAVLGIALGHALTEALGGMLQAARQAAVTGWIWVPAESWLIALALAVGVLAALLPAWGAYRTDLARTLAQG